MKLKVCGIKSLEEVEIVNKLQPDYIGFVFAESKRRVDYKTAKKLRKHLSASLKVVGVFVNDDIEFINRLVAENIIDVVQLHGNEDENYIKQVNAKTIKAVRVGETIPNNATYILFDSAVAGSGKTFNWSELPKTNKPFFLAGGINITNIEKAMQLNPFCIDVSSGAEKNGCKDYETIKSLMRKMKNE